MVLGFRASCPSISGENLMSVMNAVEAGVTLLIACASMASGMTGTNVDVSATFASGMDVGAGARGDGVCVAVGGAGVSGRDVLVVLAGSVNGCPGRYTLNPMTRSRIADPTNHQPATIRSRRWRKYVVRSPNWIARRPARKQMTPATMSERLGRLAPEKFMARIIACEDS